MGNVVVLFLKGDIPTGSRWITVHPNGKDAKGVPVLVQEESHGTYRVIGGAGGKLNYLKLRGVKSEKHYKQEANERAKAKREKDKQQRDRDKDLGVYESKKAQQDQDRSENRDDQRKYIELVAEAHGWDKERLQFSEADHAHLSEKAQSKAAEKHHADLLRQAHEAADTQKGLLVDQRLAEDAGEIPITSEDPETLTVNDLSPVQQKAGLGYATDYTERAKDRGLTEPELKAERESFQDEPSEQQRESRAARKVEAATIAKELEGLREPEPLPPKALDSATTMSILKAQKALRARQKNRRSKTDRGQEAKAYVVEVSDAELTRQVKKDIEGALSTVKTRAFLSEVGKVAGGDPDKTLGRHVGVGAYQSINSLALAATGTSLVDRDVVDVLGIAGGAQVLVRRLHGDLDAGEVDDIRQAVESFHIDHHVKESEAAVREAKELLEKAKAITLDEATDGHDLALLHSLNVERQSHLQAAQRRLGSALGEMEANASLVLALNQKPKDEVVTPLGSVSIDDAIRRARAIGLDRGDYAIHKQGVNTFLTVQASGLEKLAQPVNRDDLAHVQESLAIIEGRRDEDNWLPGGVADRPDLSLDTPPGVAPRLAEPFAVGSDLKQSIKDYIGGRMADGDSPKDIRADLNSHEMTTQLEGRLSEFDQALKALVPTQDNQGKQLPVETHQAQFEQWADDFVQSRFGETRAPLHRQTIATDQTTVDALHRALAAEPTGVAAFKPIGELTAKDQGALREVFKQTLARDDTTGETLREKLEQHTGKEPEKMTESMFGDEAENPLWTSWNNDRKALVSDIKTQSLNWANYTELMGGPANAYAAMQDQVRGRVVQGFHEAHNTLKPDAPLKLGRSTIRGNLDHLDAVDRDARERRLKELRDNNDRLRNRTQGQYAGGGIRDKQQAQRQQQEAFEQSQMGMFATLDPQEKTDTPLEKDERHTLGHAAERQLAALVSQVGKNFKPGKPTKLWQASMNGRYINQQRAVKLLDHNKRLMLAQGVGSGKTIIGLSGFTHLHSQGKVKRGLFLVPSIVQGQFSGEAIRYLKPGQYQWANNPGGSRAERLKSYTDPNNHFAVVTHQAFRDDMVHLAAEHAGIDKGAMVAQVDAMSPDERKTWMRQTMNKAGIDFQYLNVDEGHDLLNRQGKKNSTLANVVDSLSANTEYYVNASADPVKNDASEIFDVLRKMNPSRYSDRSTFMRRYGVDAVNSKEALRRELARHFYPGQISSGVTAQKKKIEVALSDAQQQRIKAIGEASANARLARLKGSVDVDAIKTLSPSSFEGIPQAEHEKLAKRLQDNIGLLKNLGTKAAIDRGPANAKVDKALSLAKERKGKPGVIFAHHRETVQQLTERLSAQGHRVVTITGSDSPKEKEAKRLMFHPEHGEPQADILVASDAAAVGLNAQRGQWLLQMDTPDTAKTHAQRNGRINRLGQQNDVELLDLVADHPHERRARKRLSEKYDLREVMTSPLEGLDDTGIASYLMHARNQTQQQAA